ncbi:MAG: MIP/aquaporin family protein [Phycisphaerae bacterium]
MQLKRALVMEFLGTFFLVLIIGLAVTQQVGAAPVVIGLTLAALVYMGGHLSGAHYNPAVTFAFAIRGRTPWVTAIKYILTQLIAAASATFLVEIWVGQMFHLSPVECHLWYRPFSVEVVGTFLLVFVILNVADARGTKGNEFYGLAIGATVVGLAACCGPISGGAFNPAVGLGPLLYWSFRQDFDMSHWMLYSIAPVLGGLMAAWVFNWLQSDEALDTNPDS